MLELRKIWLSLKMMGLGFAIPLLMAIGSCAGALPFCENAVSTIICALCLTAFVGLFLGLFLSGYLGYFRKITDRSCGLYIMGNKLWLENPENNLRRFKLVVSGACQHVYDIGRVFGCSSLHGSQDVQKLLKNTVVIFVDDIDEKGFNEQYGTKYTKIAGLCGGDKVLVEYDKGYNSLINTALEHELLHVIDIRLHQKLPYYMWRNISDRLGLDR